MEPFRSWVEGLFSLADWSSHARGALWTSNPRTGLLSSFQNEQGGTGGWESELSLIKRREICRSLAMGLIFPQRNEVARKEATWAQKSVFIFVSGKFLPRLACLHCEKTHTSHTRRLLCSFFCSCFFTSLVSFPFPLSPGTLFDHTCISRGQLLAFKDQCVKQERHTSFPQPLLL